MQRRERKRARGLTLIEVTMALAIAALAAALGVVSINALTSASLKSAAIELSGSMKYSYDRAIMEKRLQRIAFDLDKGLWWLEYTEDPFALGTERLRGEEGEKRDESSEARSSFDEDEDVEVRRALEGGRAASFKPEEGKPRRLPGEVSFSKVWTGHQEKPFTSGIAYLHFFRGGWTEPAQLELTDGEDYVTLTLSPLTGRVRTHQERLSNPDVEEDDGKAEGDE